MLVHLLHSVHGLADAAFRAFRRRLGNALRPATTNSLVLGAATDLVRGKPELVADNALLRQQLIILTRSTNRPRLTRSDRALLVLLASRVRAWRQALLIVQPATLLRWHRAGFRLVWRWRSAPRSRQPRVSPQTVVLIRRMARENPLRDLRGVHPAGLTREPSGSVPLQRSVDWSGGRPRHRRSWASVT